MKYSITSHKLTLSKVNILDIDLLRVATNALILSKSIPITKHWSCKFNTNPLNLKNPYIRKWNEKEVGCRTKQQLGQSVVRYLSFQIKLLVFQYLNFFITTLICKAKQKTTFSSVSIENSGFFFITLPFPSFNIIPIAYVCIKIPQIYWIILRIETFWFQLDLYRSFYDNKIHRY